MIGLPKELQEKLNSLDSLIKGVGSFVDIGKETHDYRINNLDSPPSAPIFGDVNSLESIFILADLNKRPLKTRRGRFGLRKRMAVRLKGFNVPWRKVDK
jgi:hypothetical protein